ncbi:uncharacterized protein LOC115767081 [Drosophila novamexicana]|uniref:uncharacterized protein LOC115767081 n=1 Tax=Drosophila novamexicana TaxID=47314 RepID=UPI0011E5ED99|nr:uncharacterized protein LOC115767081 [Drosophila novamexicana]
MDNFNVPKKINRNVMKALSVLEGKYSISAFVPAHSIVRQVEFQMRRSKKMKNMENYVMRSLCTLTHLGILARTGTSDYALRQSLRFPNGASAIPWQTPPSPEKRSRRNIKSSKSEPVSRIAKARCKPRAVIKPVRRSSRQAASKAKASEALLKQNADLCAEPRSSVDIAQDAGMLRNEATFEAQNDCTTGTSPNSLIRNERWDFNSPLPITYSSYF